MRRPVRRKHFGEIVVQSIDIEPKRKAEPDSHVRGRGAPWRARLSDQLRDGKIPTSAMMKVTQRTG